MTYEVLADGVWYKTVDSREVARLRSTITGHCFWLNVGNGLLIRTDRITQIRVVEEPKNGDN